MSLLCACHGHGRLPIVEPAFTASRRRGCGGECFGKNGAEHIRLALTCPLEKLQRAVARHAHSHAGSHAGKRITFTPDARKRFPTLLSSKDIMKFHQLMTYFHGIGLAPLRSKCYLDRFALRAAR